MAVVIGTTIADLIGPLFVSIGVTGGFPGSGNDSISGLGGNDTIVSGLGNDTLNGGTGIDKMDGGFGNDIYIVDNAADFVGEQYNDYIGGTADTVLSSVSYVLGSGIASGSNGYGIENLTLTGKAINGTGNAFDNVIIGNAGNNILKGGEGNDTIDGGTGNDTIDGGLGSDSLNGGSGIDTVDYRFYSGVLVANLATGVVSFPGIRDQTDSLTNIENLVAGAGSDQLNGDNLNNLLDGGAGNDTINGGNGNDTLNGAAGIDKLDGGYNNDIYIVDSPLDFVGEQFNDFTGGTADTIRSSASYTMGSGPTPGSNGFGIENLILTGKAVIGTGNTVDNVIIGNVANNVLNGLEGNDTIDGGAGNDTMDGGIGFDSLNGGSGVDTVDYRFYSGVLVANLATGVVSFPGLSIHTDSLTNIENLVAGAGNDQLIGDNLNNLLAGGAGNDTIDGGAGNDTIDGGIGFDSLNGGSGVDTVDYRFYNGRLVANLVTGVVSLLSIPGLSIQTDSLTNIENLVGGAGNDQLIGDNLNNLLDGGAGIDWLDGGNGDDIYIVENTLDVVGEFEYDWTPGGFDTVMSSVTYILGSGTTAGSNGYGIENLTLTGKGNINGTGNTQDNVIIGNAGHNILKGGGGSDTIDGGAGNDTIAGGLSFGDFTYYINGGSGVDVVDYRFYNGGLVANLLTGVVSFVGLPQGLELLNIESLVAGAGNDQLIAGHSNSLLDGGAGNDTIDGLEGNDILNGGAGNDMLSGRDGIDTLTGGSGADTFVLDWSGMSNADKITDFSSVDDTIALSDFLDENTGLFSAIYPGVLGLFFNGGYSAGSILDINWFYKGASSIGNGTELSGIFADISTGNIFYNPTTASPGDSVLIASISATAMAGLTNADFVYGG